MPNPFFDPGQGRAAQVRALFGRIALRYDLINDLQSLGLHRRWKKRVIELAQPHPGQSALDLCCGTGDLALGLRQRGLRVIGLDFSEQMLAVAESRKSRMLSAATIPADCLHLVRGDAQNLPFRENSFDIVMVGYGLRNLSNWETGLCEMRRVAKPGGRLLVLDFGKPQNPVWRAFYMGYLRAFVPCLGRLFCGNAAAYAYILESLRHYPAQEGVAAKMRELRLEQVGVVNLLGGAMSINYGQKRTDY